MPSAEHTVTIAKPVQDVFAFVANGENAPTWRPAVKDIKKVSGEGKGEVYKQGVSGPGGRRVAADYEVTEFEPNRGIAFRTIAGPVRPRGRYTFEEDAGGTRVSLALDVEITGLKKWLMGSAVQKSMDTEVHCLDNMKGILGG